MKYQIINAQIINEGRSFPGSVLIDEGIISRVIEDEFCQIDRFDGYKIIDAGGNYLIPGVIDDQVHFRDPGMPDKADIYTESRAAVAGGVTSFMDMPNTIPNTLTQKLLEEKYVNAAKKSFANYSFYMGASNTNLDEILKTDPKKVCGVKVFMGASTGNMLVDDIEALNGIFEKSNLLVAVHCEVEGIIQKNLTAHIGQYGENIPIKNHPQIRSAKACYESSAFAVELAKKYNTRLHILHLSTAAEMELFENKIPIEDKKITSEVCVHHLYFNDSDYDELGTLIKWNPAIKTKNDQDALLKALLDDRLDVVATDHAPHTLAEKNNTYLNAPSGGPLVQHSLNMMLEFVHDKKMDIQKVVEKMCHAPAKCFRVEKRGFIREDFFADLAIVNMNSPWTVNKKSLFYKCGWSPLEGKKFKSKITHTFVNGNLVFENGKFNERVKGKRLSFNP